ncbi:hypothetical protein C8R44DRAFT_250187 [Mycena epipterygia]|nr:hypothetical protein C8R44DRAFT_250187 [Mycena epipterygia]
MHPFSIPELLHDLAAHLEHGSDLSRLAQADRFTNAIVTPYLYQDLEIPLESVEGLAVTLGSRPELAAECRSLVIFCRDSDKTLVTSWRLQLEPRLYNYLVTIFGTIAEHGRLVKLRLDERDRLAFPENVWQAISRVASQLEELHLVVNDGEEHAWYPLTRTPFPKLRVFDLHLPFADYWDGAHLQSFLDTLTELEELSGFPRVVWAT